MNSLAIPPAGPATADQAVIPESRQFGPADFSDYDDLSGGLEKHRVGQDDWRHALTAILVASSLSIEVSPFESRRIDFSVHGRKPKLPELGIQNNPTRQDF